MVPLKFLIYHNIISHVSPPVIPKSEPEGKGVIYVGSKLKRRTKLKPRLYENRNKYAKIAENIKISKNCFSDIFTSMQMINYYILYYEFDFSKKKVENFSETLTKHNQEYDDGVLIPDVLEEKIRTGLKFDCWKEAMNFPYRSRRKMFAGKTKNMADYEIFLTSTNAAIETYLILAVYTLHENYRFTGKMLQIWWEKFIDFAMLYADGLTDDHIEKYFKQECNLEIVK